MSQLLALGVDIETIKSIVGHADIDMTEHYLHVQEPIRQAAVARFSEAFGTEKKKSGQESSSKCKIIPLYNLCNIYNGISGQNSGQ